MTIDRGDICNNKEAIVIVIRERKSTKINQLSPNNWTDLPLLIVVYVYLRPINMLVGCYNQVQVDQCVAFLNVCAYRNTIKRKRKRCGKWFPVMEKNRPLFWESIDEKMDEFENSRSLRWPWILKTSILSTMNQSTSLANACFFILEEEQQRNGMWQKFMPAGGCV